MKHPLAVGAASLAILFSLGLAACGSSDNSSEDALPKSELIAQADEICKSGNEALDQKISDTFGNETPSKDEVVTFLDQEILPAIRSELEKLRELQPEEADADAWNNVLDTLETEIQAVEDDPESTYTKKELFPDSSAAAQDFGLTVCGSS